MWMMYVANGLACVGIVGVINNHIPLNLLEVCGLSFALAWFWGKS